MRRDILRYKLWGLQIVLGWGGRNLRYKLWGVCKTWIKRKILRCGLWGLQELSLGRREILRHRLWGLQDLDEEGDFQVQVSRSTKAVLGWGERTWGIYWVVQWSWFAQVNALCNLSRKKSREVAASLPGRFLSRRCFTLCVTMQVELRIAKQYKCHHCCSCTKLLGKVDGGWEKMSLRRFLADQKIASSGKKCLLGHPITRATSFCLLPDTFWLRAFKNAFKVGSVKFANSLSPPSIVKNVYTRSKSSQGT